ncbi:ferrichrome/ferrioxamine B periplasmic transporter [Bordetella ansorpii]|uniref:Ferrichrome/ferrioxamine B periplasmic transporter n=1 Tax=Bordetella ansorpii TaxID=288768 RepID=A0A157NIT6_9BORD|nr:ABC transporter substrate-binding protein [Bordetella ansorpii]SAI21235.1 ferrichrome/ferrioxamine B periplasmic transporter [Bordetella ansorpii]
MRRALRRALLGGLLALCAASATRAERPQAAAYPVTVTDAAGRQVRIERAPRRIYLQNGNDIVAMALLDREDPFARILAWRNSLNDSDPTIWRLMRQRWPHAADIPELAFDNGGNADVERLVRLRPDMLIMDLDTRGAVERGPLARIMAQLRVPIVYLDSSKDPLNNVPTGLRAVGAALNQRERADAYLAFYEQRRAAVQAGIDAASHHPLVFIEARAGRQGLDQCCYSQAETSWGKLIGQAGARNYASLLLRGATGDIAMETLIRNKPDVYVMTGTARVRAGAHVIPFGYGATQQRARQAMALLMNRPGFARIARRPGDCAVGFYHQFYNSAFNIAGFEYLARALYPQTLGQLDPDATYRRILATYTDIPDAPFLFETRRAFDGQGACPP